MSIKSVRVVAPATVANVGCGFDILGFALSNPFDEVIISYNDYHRGLVIENQTPFQQIPTQVEKNTCGLAAQAFLDTLFTEKNYLVEGGIRITMTKKIPAGSGVGSSAAGAAATVWGLNELFDNPFSPNELVRFAMEGERAACGTAHADNVAPAILGGFVLVRSYDPLDIIKLHYPSIWAVVVHPQIELKTEDSRNVLRRTLALRDAVTQWGNIAGLVAGLHQEDFGLIGRSLQDVVVEPTRSLLIPNYEHVKQTAIQYGALGASISGSGPSVFALCENEQTAQQVGKAMRGEFEKVDIDAFVYCSNVAFEGAKVVEKK